MKRTLVFAVACFAASSLIAQEPMCATGERTNEILAYLQERLDHQPRDRARMLASPFALRDGTFTMSGDNGVSVNGRANNLVGQTIEFQPLDATHYTLRHVAYAYVEPSTAPLQQFTSSSVHYVKWNMVSTPLTLFCEQHGSLLLPQ